MSCLTKGNMTLPYHIGKNSIETGSPKHNKGKILSEMVRNTLNWQICFIFRKKNTKKAKRISFLQGPETHKDENILRKNRLWHPTTTG